MFKLDNLIKLQSAAVETGRFREPYQIQWK